MTHTDYVDGNLRCTKNGVHEDILLWGGIKSIDVAHDPGNVVADNDNFAINAIDIYTSKNGTSVIDTNQTDGARNIDIVSTTYSEGIVGLGVSNPFSCNFTNGSSTCVTTFDLDKAETGKNIVVGLHSRTFTIGSINISPNKAATVNVVGLSTTPEAGDTLSATVTILDQFGNLTDQDATSGNCSALVVSTNNGSSPGGITGTTDKAPDLPAPVSEASIGTYNVSGIALYNAATSNVTFAGCGLPGENVSVTVAADSSSIGNVYTSDTDSRPGSHLTNKTLTEGTTLTETFYAWAWDAWGNELGGNTWSCPSWSYQVASGATPSLNNSSGHSVTVSTSDAHLDGTLRCIAASVNYDTTITGKIQKNISLSCGNWSCSSETPEASCTVTNNSGYDIDSISFSTTNSGDNALSDNCSSLANGTSCTVTVTGTSLATSGTISTTSITPIASHSSLVTFLLQNDTAASGAAAPNCTNSLTSLVGSWSCAAGQGSITATFSNPSSIYNATMSAGAVSASPAANFVTQSDSCSSSTLNMNDSNTCDVELRNPVSGKSTTLTLTPDGPYFSPKNQEVPPSPNCTLDASTVVSVQSVCSTGNKTLRVTLTNNNTINDMVLSTVSVTDGLGSLGSDNCSNATLNSSGSSCFFDVEYIGNAPATNSFGVSIPATDGYFNSINLGTSDGDNSCL